MVAFLTISFSCLQLRFLMLADNQFSGHIEEFPVVNDLELLDLSNNMIKGPVPSSFQFQNISSLSLFGNLFDGTFHLQKIQSLSKLKRLDLSYNNLSINTTNLSSNFDGFPQLVILNLASCNMYEFPYLGDQSSLLTLDLSNNHIGGDIPSWIWETGRGYLNLSFNLLTGLEKPHFVAIVEYLDLQSNKLLRPVLLFSIITSPNSSDSVIFLGNNQLTGVIPTSICNAFLIRVLDLSFNNLSGSIPSCLINKSFVSEVLNLRGNKISGVIPDQFPSKCSLETFDVSNNNLGGKVPKSLINCKNLEVLNVGNNNLDGRFPCMLPLKLHILVLRSNKFHGDLRCRRSWPNLQILYISSNNFSGNVSLLNFSSLRGIMLQESYTWNAFTGSIPNSLGELTELGSLDLSENKLTGRIPEDITKLFLSILNVSYNYNELT
ncbi:receptor like protein 27-like [Salvia hispanica]|uniref:receptor like protein 27-like n=1 Tax=Salvia hispanica TaxID=49212 RepID=UPI002009C398|nr:receptor like protein 27-like [Salvia hispanica]